MIKLTQLLKELGINKPNVSVDEIYQSQLNKLYKELKQLEDGKKIKHR